MMTLYKEIKNILKAENGTCKINNFCYLKKWTCDRYDKKIDCLTLEFYAINGRSFTGIYTINSRDIEGVKKEISDAINDAMQEITERLTMDLYAGYR